MPFPPIQAGTTTEITLSNVYGYEGYLWHFYDFQTATVLASDSTPNGYNLTPTADPTRYNATLPDTAPVGDDLSIVFYNPGAGTEHYDTYTVTPAPTNTNTGFNLRQINIPFRRRRPAKRIQNF